MGDEATVMMVAAMKRVYAQMSTQRAELERRIDAIKAEAAPFQARLDQLDQEQEWRLLRVIQHYEPDFGREDWQRERDKVNG